MANKIMWPFCDLVSALISSESVSEATVGLRYPKSSQVHRLGCTYLYKKTKTPPPFVSSLDHSPLGLH